jgi:predicted acylesterase/phospholipase RssA/energy-coupling factor transporter ATP-binding protein EcfA2
MINPLPQLYVDAVTYSEEDESKQEDLHYEDRVASWFTIRPDAEDKDILRLIVTDRFRQLCNPGIADNKWSANQYPSFVSFIGNTGVGKSTILRAMLLMGQIQKMSSELDDENTRLSGLKTMIATRAQGPVTRSANLNHLTNPTSLGVHLYRDVQPTNSEQAGANGIPTGKSTPILFADCEGFGAGNASLTSERVRHESSGRRDRSSSRQRSERPRTMRRSSAEMSYSAHRVRPFENAVSDRPILAKSYGKQGRGSELFYARFLYAISDVLVFVTKDDQTFQTDMQRLMEWSAAAIYNSVNHVAHKTLIIVRNMPSGAHKPELYSPETLEAVMFRNLKPLWEASETIQTFMDDHNNKQINSYSAQKIANNKDLFGVFFQQIKFCYIPDKKGRPPKELYQQYQVLRHQITVASQEGQESRRKCWIQYNVPALSYILNRAFEHFRTTDKPFDFYTAARNDNPNPVSMAEHIANLLRHLHELRSENMVTRSKIIAICLVTSAVRFMNQVYDPHVIWNTHLKHECEVALDIFGNKYQRCGFTFPDGMSCIARKMTHDQHCNEKGTRLPGLFTDSSLKRSPQNDPLYQIHKDFVRFYEMACDRGAHGGQSLPTAKSLRELRENVFREFQPVWECIASNKTCFTCLHGVPDHVMPCGHVYCSRCVEDFGRSSDDYECAWIIKECVLCRTRWPQSPQLIRMKPRCAGVRILSLDGGGIRGIIELAILEKLLNKVNLGLANPIPELFDLVVGTSTGGIIALGLTSIQEMTIGQMKKTFLDLAKRTFEKDRSGFIGRFDPLQLFVKALMLIRITDSIYSPDPLRDALIGLFGPDVRLFSSPKKTRVQRSTRVAVTSTKNKAANRCLIANYNRLKFGNEKRPHQDNYIPPEDDFEREDEDHLEMRTWEAGLATAAAPFYFPEFYKPETKKDYVDGALHANFPGAYALEEMDKIWSKPGIDAALDVLVSIGTGLQHRDVNLPAALKIGGFDAICTSFHKNIESEKLYKGFMNGIFGKPHLDGKIHRLNATIDGDYVALFDHKMMKSLDQMVTSQMNSKQGCPSLLSDNIASLANTLLASLFFVEADENQYEGIDNPTLTPYQEHRRIFQFKGSIRCRLCFDSPELKTLVNRVAGFYQTELRRGANLGSELPQWTPIPFTDQQRNAIRTQRDKFRVNFKIKTDDEADKQQVIVVCFRSERPEIKNAISGFPVTLVDLKKRAGIIMR